MNINLKNAVPRLFPDPRFEMIYFEAVSNALDAGATEINIGIEYDNSDFKKFIIVDNGIGFNEENYNRFSELMETKDNAHKGQGRVVYLIYFENVEITSYFLEGNLYKKRQFNFSYDFQKNNSSVSDEISSGISQGTRLSFSGKVSKKISKLDSLRADYIREQIFAEFLPCLFQKKQKNENFEILIKTSINNEKSSARINIQDIPEFKSIPLQTSELIGSNQSGQVLRNPESFLYYFLKKDEMNSGVSSVITSFAIDNRAKRIDIIDKPNYLPNLEATFFLVSEHFEGCVDSTRQELTLKPDELKLVKMVFKKYVKSILTSEFNQEYEEIRNSRKDFLLNRFPHLMDYIDGDEIGFKSNQDIIKEAQNEFFKKQREILEKENLDEEDYQKALDLSARNLVEYILFRQIQIEQLQKVKAEDREKVIHNIISPMRETYLGGCDNNLLFRNNAWILDDRFMTYIQAASDITLKEITRQFNKIFQQHTDSEDRPDYLMFFSNQIENENDKVDLVCFEFKRLGVRLEEKTKAVTELTKYIKQLRDVCKNIQRVWLYALVDFDDDLEQSLEAQDFKMKFSTQGKIWYRYYENIESELAFLDFGAVVSDANSRNKTFMEILKKGFSYEKE
ncbi:ATP-binding protein [Neisseria yangbaofengii]|uniref:ATP-binding protein n=1 Tax=Neisseria yangbaofengii TaxID=2709396 RepID=UPI0013EDDE25|nr:ATP-binding protein [Neisseria yangbaofengii]